MACCNTTPCSCVSPVTCCTPTVESVEYTFENANMAGIGVFDNDTANLVQFRGVVSNSAALTVTLNATDNTIVLAFDPAALVADIPNASTTVRGILETATNAEALAKAATDKILTPSNLAALGSTSTFAGLVELATDAETIAGASATLAVTPAGLAAAGSLYRTTTFTDAVDRGGTAAEFDGQFASQLDTETAWVAGSTVAGDWNPLLTLGASNTCLAGTTINLNGQSIVLVGNGDLILTNAVFRQTGAVSLFYGSETNFGVVAGDSQIVNFANIVLRIANTDVPANSVITTSASLGEPSSRLLSTFLSTANTAVYGIPTGTLARTTFLAYPGQVVSNPPTQAQVQTIDDALLIVSRRLAALITDLIITVKPTG